MEGVKVTVLRLSGCSFCSELMEELDNCNVNYASFDADEVSDFADKIEIIVGTTAYPIVIVDSEEEGPHFLFRAKTYDEVGTTPLIDAKKTGTYSIGEMVEMILKLI